MQQKQAGGDNMAPAHVIGVRFYSCRGIGIMQAATMLSNRHQKKHRAATAGEVELSQHDAGERLYSILALWPNNGRPRQCQLNEISAIIKA